MPTETHINDFKINVLTKEQFNDIEEKDANQVYLITNETAGGGIPTTTAILKGDGNGNAIAAIADVDYQTPIETEKVEETATETLEEIAIDVTPTNNSNNLVTSGGVYSALSNMYIKPSSGIPASDIADGVIPEVENATEISISTNISSSSTDAEIPSAKAVYNIIPSVPTALSQLTTDSTHRIVTDTEKTAWNGKANVYVQTTAPSSPSVGDIWCNPDESAASIPTKVSDLINDSGFLTLGTLPIYNGEVV